MKTRNLVLRMGTRGNLWTLQQRKEFLFIPYWKTILSSPSMDDVDKKANQLLNIHSNA